LHSASQALQLPLSTILIARLPINFFLILSFIFASIALISLSNSKFSVKIFSFNLLFQKFTIFILSFNLPNKFGIKKFAPR